MGTMKTEFIDKFFFQELAAQDPISRILIFLLLLLCRQEVHG